MIRQRIHGFYILFVVAQLLAALLAYGVHFVTFSRWHGEVPDPLNYIVYCCLFLLGLGFEANAKSSDGMMEWSQDLRRRHVGVGRQVLFASLPVIFFLVLTKDVGISRLFLIIYLPLLYLVLLISRVILPNILSRIIFAGKHEEKTLIVGSPERVARLSAWLEAKKRFGVVGIGYLSNQPETQSAYPLLGQISEIAAVAAKFSFQQVIVLGPLDNPEQTKMVIDFCEGTGVRLMILSQMEEALRRKLAYIGDEEMHFFGLRHEPLQSPVNRAMKRAIDISLSLPVVLFVVPIVTAIVWMFQKIQSPGPLFYHQQRMGFYNKPFEILKFRTMHLDNSNKAKQATKADSRIYPFGRILRRYSLDELPQFVNVLRGDMSVVGPRPHLQEHNDQFSQILGNYHTRTFIKPGITGLAQVRGFRGETPDPISIVQRVESDIVYLESWSLSVEGSIIVQTAWQMLFPPKSAY